MSQEKAKTYICANCKGEFEFGWSDEEARQEAKENFPDLDVDDSVTAVVVCHDCYLLIMGEHQTEIKD